MLKKPFWEQKAPKDATHSHLDKKQVQLAKAKARVAGRPYPNLIDNVAASRAKGKSK
jgi:hypothetical protein